MVISKPPRHRTAALRARLHGASLVLRAFALFGLALLALPHAAGARLGAIRVLVYTSVTDQARATISPELWAKFVSSYAGGDAVSFDGAVAPTIDDCRKAGAQYMLVAPFDLRPRLPGRANATGRIAAVARLTATNCITSEVSLDRNIDFDSDPPSNASDGDYESAPEVTWARAIPATLARMPLAFQRVARVFSVNSPFALVDLRGGGTLFAGDSLRDFATPDGKARTTPIALTITQVFGSYVEVTFAQTGIPENGDLVEPLPKTPSL